MPSDASQFPEPNPAQPYPGRDTQGNPQRPESQLELKPRPDPTPTASIPRTGSARIALAHDWLVGLRGGEIVLDSIVRTIHSTPGLSTGRLYTLFANGEPLTEALDALQTRVSGLNPLVGGRRWLLPAYPAGASMLTRQLARDHREEPIDLLLSTSSVAAKAVRPPGSTPHLCYCHTPARYLWDQQHEYTRNHPLRSTGLRALSPWLRSWDRKSATGVTRFLANSSFTADRIERYWGCQATVVHPPIETGFFTPGERGTRQSFWLVVSALEPYKRVDLVIEAAKRARQPLIIVGEGSERRARRDQAAGSPWIEFKRRVSRETLRDLYREARCLVFPQVEDFGMAAAEAQACGCPVVARAQGGATEIVIDGQTGSLFTEPNADAIRHAVHRLPEQCESACQTNAARFSVERFERSIREAMFQALSDRSGQRENATRTPADSELSVV